MIKITLETGKTYEAETYERLITVLARTSYLQESKFDYMANVAKRCNIWNGAEIEYHNAESFIKELQRVGVVQELWEE